MFRTGASASAAPQAPPAGIIGGTSTSVGQYPSVVGLVVGNNLCTGTLITPNWVLTAGHCVDPSLLGLASQDEVTANMRVHFYTVDLTKDPGVVLGASATIKDPLFSRNRLGANDLGLVKLASPVTGIVPSPVNLVAALAPIGTVVTMVGYGNTEIGAQGAIGIQFELANRTSVACPSLGIGTDANLLCFSQADQHGTCQGDSGGPAFATIGGKQVVVGVTSFGDQQCAEYGADTRIDIEQAFLVMHVPEIMGCVSDGDCRTGQVCFARDCIAEPFGPGGLGSVCDSAVDCDSSQCAKSTQDGQRCSFGCSVNNRDSCPDGFECLPAMGDLGACWPATGGGCCQAGGGGPGAIVLGLGVAMIARRRKRKRR